MPRNSDKNLDDMLKKFFSDPNTTQTKTKPQNRKTGYRGPRGPQLPPDMNIDIPPKK